nr:GNAT family N-acetyltransferase [Maliibacterium massiliense]
MRRILSINPPHRRALLPLLLLADPEEAVVAAYLKQGTLFCCRWQGRICGVLLLVPHSARVCELKNLAVAPALQRQGIGTLLVRAACAAARRRYDAMIVGTALADGSTVAFYTRLGFVYDHTDEGFFVRNYSQPVIDNGYLCQDMLFFRRTL